MTSSKDKYRKPDVIEQEIHDLDLASVSSREWLKKNPNDKIVRLLTEQDDIRKTYLLKELEDSYKYHRQHQIIYAIKNRLCVDIRDLSELLSVFGKVIDETLKALPNTKDTESLPMNFSTVVHSSFGILMSTEWDSGLIGTNIERTFDRFFDILNVLEEPSSNSIETLISKYFINKELMRRYRSFYRGISNYKHSIEIKWNSYVESKKRAFIIDHNKAIEIYKKLISLDEPIIEEYEVTGSIQGVSLIDKSLQFIPHKKEGTRLKLSFDESFSEPLKHLLGEVAKISYMIKTDYDPIKDRSVIRKILLKIFYE